MCLYFVTLNSETLQATQDGCHQVEHLHDIMLMLFACDWSVEFVAPPTLSWGPLSLVSVKLNCMLSE